MRLKRIIVLNSPRTIAVARMGTRARRWLGRSYTHTTSKITGPERPPTVASDRGYTDAGRSMRAVSTFVVAAAHLASNGIVITSM